ncbi:hypothetical protein [Lacinutrix sp. Hel_I_90]|uniref:hypothetical protein n=1 Tax=Lacinutrix sp. Hel_I_90 TaxID=1249999 RepID=UPI0005C930E1|nr:hypothetical protein [Lacinutrix sp. Hel_I_90]
MKTTKYKFLKHLLLACFFLLFASCKTALAPKYDAIIIENLNASATETLSFLATISDGTDSDSFVKREAVYNALIGAFETLELLARARPLPKNNATKRINVILNTRGKPSIENDYPSAFAFKRIAENIKKMKDTDRTSGLKPFAIAAFKGELLIFLDQALTYESFLKR